jgi:hypothetical protein
MAIVREELTNEDGQVVDIYIEVDQVDLPDIDLERDERGIPEPPPQNFPRIEKGFKSAMGLIRTCAKHVADSLKEVPEAARPDGIELQFAIKIDASVGALIAEAKTGTQLQVTLRWGKE